MGAIPLSELEAYLDAYLSIGEIPDFPGAMNGLQVEGPATVSRITAAVDACETTIRAAADAEAHLLLVHHGLFWGAPFRLTGPRYRRFRELLSRGIAVYSAHLPLDVHPEVGNNFVLASLLGLRIDGEFSEYQGLAVGRHGAWDGTVADLAQSLARELGRDPRVLEFGPERVRRLGILTGSAGSAVAEAAALGIDTLVTGEASHPTYFDAEENGVNLLLAGHYATETVGVRALAGHLADRFGLDWSFVDHPTGF